MIIKKVEGIKHYNGAVIEYEFLNSLNLKVRVINNGINMSALLKIILAYVKGLDNTYYKRVCPYRIIHEKARYREDKKHIFKMEYLQLNNDELISKSKEILGTNKLLTVDEGIYRFFIPDLLDLVVHKKYAKQSDNSYIINHEKVDDIKDRCDIVSRIDIGELEKQGWKVPDGFLEKISSKKDEDLNE